MGSEEDELKDLKFFKSLESPPPEDAEVVKYVYETEYFQKPSPPHDEINWEYLYKEMRLRVDRQRREFKQKKHFLIGEFISRLEQIADEDDLYKTKQYYEKKLEKYSEDQDK